MDITSVSNSYYTIWRTRLEGSLGEYGPTYKPDYLPASLNEIALAHKQTIQRQFNNYLMTSDIVKAFEKISFELRVRIPYVKLVTLTDVSIIRFVGNDRKEKSNWQENVRAAMNDPIIKKRFLEIMNEGLRHVFQ